MNPWLVLLLVLFVIVFCLWRWQKKVPRPEELHRLLAQETLREKKDHGVKRRINNHLPRYVVNNSHIAVVYWRTKHPDGGDVVETILFLHPTKKGEVVVTFRNSIFTLWSWSGFSGPPIDRQNTLILEKILAKVKAAHL